MYIITKENNTSNYYIKTFSTNKDPYNIRTNKCVDIRYGELKINFNENKIFLNFDIHIAGNFNVPVGSILAKAVMPGQSVSQISLYKQNTKIPANFQYGFPDASQIYSATIVLDMNEDQFLSNNINSMFQINLSFDLNVSQFDKISESEITVESISNFINDLKNISLIFDINLYQKNSYDLTEIFVSNINQIKSIWISSQVKQLNETIKYGNQSNTYNNFQFIVPNYNDSNQSFFDLLSIKKLNNTALKAEIISFKVGYYKENQLFETNSISDLQENNVLTANFYNYSLKNYQLIKDNKTNLYQLNIGTNGIFFDQNMTGYYLIIVKITIDGSSRTYTIKN
ncbi:MAG: hypothetical protein K2K18_00775, partial [Malacoplasma sp.]|nr:hypothetical protein [Malacoplasma sp.]